MPLLVSSCFENYFLSLLHCAIVAHVIGKIIKAFHNVRKNALLK